MLLDAVAGTDTVTVWLLPAATLNGVAGDVVAPAGSPESLGAMSRPPALSVKVTVPKDSPMPVALIELTVAVAVPAPAVLGLNKRKLARKKLRIAIDLN